MFNDDFSDTDEDENKIEEQLKIQFKEKQEKILTDAKSQEKQQSRTQYDKYI